MICLVWPNAGVAYEALRRRKSTDKTEVARRMRKRGLPIYGGELERDHVPEVDDNDLGKRILRVPMVVELHATLPTPFC